MTTRHVYNGNPTDWPRPQPYDTIFVPWRPAPYNLKIHAYCPMTLECGLGPNGERTVFDASQAVEVYTPGYALPVGNSGLLTVCPPAGTAYTAGPIIGVNVLNAEFRGANVNALGFVRYSDGQPNGWFEASSGAAVYWCDGAYFHNCRYFDNGNGLFGKSYAEANRCLRNVTVHGCEFEGNGTIGSSHQHNAYIEAIGTLYEFCTFRAIRPGASGTGCKDRSAGFVFRYNLVEDGSRLLDLVDPEDGGANIGEDPRYGLDHLYGCILSKPADRYKVTPIHYGFDSSGVYPRKLLKCYFNTLTNWNDQTTDAYGTAFFKLNNSGVQCVNNLFAAMSPDPSHWRGTLGLGSEEYGPGSVTLFTNGQPSDMDFSGLTSVIQAGNPYGAVLVDDPGFMGALNGDYSLQLGSLCRGKAVPLGSDWMPCEYQYNPSTGKWDPRPGLTVLGAIES